jgi:DNA-directed RNA polymerase subunit RPC12/RpoP
MADMKFSCPQCSQHISCDEAWAGHEIACPVCQGAIVVPQFHAPPAAPPPTAPSREAAKPGGAKLAAGVTQLARSTAHAPAPGKKIIPRGPRSNNSLIGYAILLLVVAGLAWVGYFYGLPMLKDTFPSSAPTAGAGAPKGGGTRGGPLGEVNEAMDASDALDGGSSSARNRRPAATNNPARPKPAERPR